MSNKDFTIIKFQLYNTVLLTVEPVHISNHQMLKLLYSSYEFWFVVWVAILNIA